MTSCLPHFGESCGIHVHWYFTKAVAEILCTRNIVVSHENEPRCIEWENAARRLNLNVRTTDPGEHSLLTPDQDRAIMEGRNLAEMEETLFTLFPDRLHAALKRVISSSNTR